MLLSCSQESILETFFWGNTFPVFLKKYCKYDLIIMVIKQSGLVITYGTVQYNMTLYTASEWQRQFELTKYIWYVAHMCELWDIYCWHLKEKLQWSWIILEWMKSGFLYGMVIFFYRPTKKSHSWFERNIVVCVLISQSELHYKFIKPCCINHHVILLDYSCIISWQWIKLQHVMHNKKCLIRNMNSFYFLRTSVVDIWWVQLFNGPYSCYKNVNKPHKKLLWNWSLKVYRSWGKVTLLQNKKCGNHDWPETNPYISE